MVRTPLARNPYCESEHSGTDWTPHSATSVTRDDGRGRFARRLKFVVCLIPVYSREGLPKALDEVGLFQRLEGDVLVGLHTGAYWLLWSLRSLMPKRSTWRVAQFDTLRLRLAKLATRVVALKTRIMLHLPSACPDKAILRLALERLPRLTC